MYIKQSPKAAKNKNETWIIEKTSKTQKITL
jgi:hypothetical protein